MIFNVPFILASNSPRRQQLLKEAGLAFQVKSKNVKEEYPNHLKREEIPLYLSKLKAEAFLGELSNEVLIAADTIVHLDGNIIEKPYDRTRAIHMLQQLSGNRHEVITGVTILSERSFTTFFEVTEVYFSPIALSSIEYYVDQYQPFDKAGAYGIQEWIGLTHVRKIHGCFYNVMGLPVQRLFEVLKTIPFPNQ
jgi:septum formation protein